MNNLIKYNYFNPEYIKFLKKKQYDSIAKIGLCYYHTPTFKNYICFKTPWMLIPFGLGRYDNNTNDSKYYLDLSFYGIYNDVYLQQFHNIIDKLDNFVIYHIRKNIDDYELDKLLPKVNLKKYYTNSLRYNINKETLQKETRYPPTIKLKLFAKNLKLKDRYGNPLIKNNLRKGVYVRANIKCNGMWILPNKFGLTWTAREIQISNTKVENCEDTSGYF